MHIEHTLANYYVSERVDAGAGEEGNWIKVSATCCVYFIAVLDIGLYLFFLNESPHMHQP